MLSSPNRSAPIPLSFDRFRGKSIQFLPPFRHHHNDACTKQSPERSRIRKTQVQPNECLPTEHNPVDHDVTHLFHANSKTPSNKKCSKTRSTSKINDSKRSSPPPTPYMIGYRQSSLPNLIPKHMIKRPKTFNDLSKHSTK